MAGITLLLGGCGFNELETTPTPEITHLPLVTTSTLAPLVESLAQAYIRQDVLFLISPHETDWRGLENQVSADDTLYGLTTYLPESSALWATPLGEDGIAIITEPDTDIPVLTASQLRGIFTGGIQDWADLGGAESPLTVVSYGDGSDTRLAFERMVLGDRQITPAARLAPTAPAMLDIVATTPGAVGYVSFGLVDHRVRVVPIAGTPDETPLAPSLANIADGSYPLRTPILLVGGKAPSPGSPAYEFFLWAQQGGGQGIIGRKYVPLGAE